MKKGASGLTVLATIALILVAISAVGGLLIYASRGPSTQQTIIQEKTGDLLDQCTVQETATYSTIDVYSTTTPAGTSYYKENGKKAQTTALSNIKKGLEYTYWLDNESYFVEPETVKVECGPNLFQAEGWNVVNATITTYDTVNDQPTTDGKYNTSMAANAQAKIKITYAGTYKKSNMPFGGLMVLEYNNTIATVSCTGTDIASVGKGPYSLTYQPQSTRNSYTTLQLADTIDNGKGEVHTINCQFNNGATATGLEAPWYITLIPANYYITNNGEILLDTEQNANGLTTRTAPLGYRGLTFSTHSHWGA